MRQSQAVRRLVDHWNRNGYVFTWAEAARLGVESATLGDLVRHGLIVRFHPGVYAPAAAAREPVVVINAALRAAERPRGAGRRTRMAAVSHGTAAWAQGLLDRSPGPVHLTVVAAHALRLEGVVVHRCQDPYLPRRPFRGVVCTAPARTLVDLAATVGPLELADAVDRALSLRLVRVRDLLAETSPSGCAGRRGTKRLRRCLHERGDTGAPAPSVLESRMARLLRRFSLPSAKAELVAGPAGEYRLDYAYPLERLAVELYGYASHHSPDQMAGDLARQRRLTIEGWQVLIYTWQDVIFEPERVAGELLHALAGRGRPGRAQDPEVARRV